MSLSVQSSHSGIMELQQLENHQQLVEDVIAQCSNHEADRIRIKLHPGFVELCIRLLTKNIAITPAILHALIRKADSIALPIFFEQTPLINSDNQYLKNSLYYKAFMYNQSTSVELFRRVFQEAVNDNLFDDALMEPFLHRTFLNETLKKENFCLLSDLFQNPSVDSKLKNQAFTSLIAKIKNLGKEGLVMQAHDIIKALPEISLNEDEESIKEKCRKTLDVELARIIE